MTITNTVLLIAIVAAGETVPSLPPEAAEMVMHAALNRVADPRWPDTVMEVLLQPGQFNGRGDPWAYYPMARRVLRRDHDPTGGILFVISGDDRWELGCPPGDIIYVGGHHSMHGYYEWCQ